MKLFYIANIRFPTEKAHGLQIAKMCAAFASKGMEVELIVPQRSNPIKENAFKFYDIKENFKISEIYSFDFLRFEKTGGFFIYVQAFIFALGVFLHVLFYPNKFGREDIFYLRDEFSPWLLTLLNKKIFIEIHAFADRFRHYRGFFPRLKGLVLVTRKAAEEFIALGMPEEKIIIAPDGVDLNRFKMELSKEEAREKKGLPGDKIILGYTGRLKTMGMDKGVSDILKAIKILNNNKILFIAAGGSSDDIDFFKKQAQEIGVDKQIEFLPFCRQAELAVYQKACDILLMPFPNIKHYAFYMSPLKMFEYMASGRPIIATDLPAIREILNEHNAFLVAPDDPEALARVIEKVLADQDFAGQIAQQALIDVQNYTWEKRVAIILTFINRS